MIDPIHYGFSDSIIRYHELARRHPDVDIMMGIGNLTELTHADTLGINMMIAGIASELGVTGLLTTEVSGHCRTAVRELNQIRRVLYAAREDHTPPRHLDESLMALHDRHPYPYDTDEIAALAVQVKDDDFRIQTSDDTVHIYNRRGHSTGLDPYDLFPSLGVEDDGAHAFYLGMELERARIAATLGKRYVQDETLDWGVTVPKAMDDKRFFAEERTTLKARRQRKKKKPS